MMMMRVRRCVMIFVPVVGSLTMICGKRRTRCYDEIE